MLVLSVGGSFLPVNLFEIEALGIRVLNEVSGRLAQMRPRSEMSPGADPSLSRENIVLQNKSEGIGSYSAGLLTRSDQPNIRSIDSKCPQVTDHQN